MTRSDWLQLTTTEQQAFIASLDDNEAMYFLHTWEIWARDNQLPPAGDWIGWLLLAGRGFGKTRTAAEYIRQQVNTGLCGRIAVIGRTKDDVRDVVVNGESGILSVFPKSEKPHYIDSRRTIEFANGAIATVYSADEPDTFRGPQYNLAWFDELLTYSQAQEVFDQVMFGLRLGTKPRWIATTTPRPIALARQLTLDPHIAVTRGSTLENQANLAPTFISKILQKYEGTRLGRQEIYGEILDDNPNALFSRINIDETRVHEYPPLYRIVVAIDPAVTNTETSDATGIIVAGIGTDNHYYVLEDSTLKSSVGVWGSQALACYNRHKADIIVGETNNGGDLVEANLRACGNSSIPYKSVHASRGKFIRAEPVGALYEQKRVHHVGMFNELEDELCSWDPSVNKSPNRLDALVWAITWLMDNEHTQVVYDYKSCASQDSWFRA